MYRVSPIGLGLALALALGASVAGVPASAQQQQAAGQPAPRNYRVTKQERAALAPLQAAVAARNWTAAAAALPAAQAGARSSDARYILARLQFQIALDTQNAPMQAQAIQALIASGDLSQAELPGLLQNQVAIASRNGDTRGIEAALVRLIELDPNHSGALKDLARIRTDQRRPAEAVALLDRAITARSATGQVAPQSWYKFALRLAVDGKMAAPSLKLGRGLIAAYPTPENWRDVLIAYREVGRPGDATGIDSWRLMRASKALAGERDYLQFAQAAEAAGLAAEAKAVLDEGVSRRMVDPSKSAFKELIASATRRAAADRAGLAGRQSAALSPTATAAAGLAAGDATFGAGDYAKAASIYRAASLKGGADGSLAALRLGQALALAGQRAEAEAALGAVAGPGADLAVLWLAWLRQPV